MTDQIRDEVKYEGKWLDWDRSPWLPESHPGLIIEDDEYDEFGLSVHFSTACQKGYVSSWGIANGRLYLVSINGRYRLAGDAPLFADWFSCVASIGYGRDWDAYSYYEKLLHIEFDHGIVIGMRKEQGADIAAAKKRKHWTEHLYYQIAMRCTELDRIIDRLIEQGADVNAADIKSNYADVVMPPLHFACMKDFMGVAVKALISKGANVNAVDAEGKTPLDIALEHRNDDVAEILRRHGAKRMGEERA